MKVVHVYAPIENIPIPFFHSQNGGPKTKWEKREMENKIKGGKIR